jgi:hypothetical protein
MFRTSSSNLDVSSHADETGSQCSEISAATSDSRSNWNSISFFSKSDGQAEELLDISLRSLYEDPDILERRCKMSAFGEKWNPLEERDFQEKSNQQQG